MGERYSNAYSSRRGNTNDYRLHIEFLYTLAQKDVGEYRQILNESKIVLIQDLKVSLRQPFL
jgi:hypothetical protein